jgi:hypothetical protein
MTGYEAFSLYNSLKLHFSSDSYDFFKYHGKSNISIESFEKRKDKYHFYKLSRRQDDNDYVQFLVSNFLENESCWAGDLLQEDAIVRYKERMKVIQSLGYMFQSDCQKLKEVFEDPNELLQSDNGDYPVLLKMTLQKVTHIETLCILNSLMGFLPMWKRKITDTIRYPEIHRKVLKYTPFIEFDKEKFRGILIKELL